MTIRLQRAETSGPRSITGCRSTALCAECRIREAVASGFDVAGNAPKRGLARTDRHRQVVPAKRLAQVDRQVRGVAATHRQLAVDARALIGTGDAEADTLRAQVLQLQLQVAVGDVIAVGDFDLRML